VKGRRLFVLLVAVMAITGLVIAGCAPEEAAPPSGEDEGQAPEEEEEAAPAAPSDETFEWRMQMPFPTSFVMYQVGDVFTDFVKDMSGGRLVITNNAGGAIVDGLKEMRAVHEGVLDCTLTGSHYHTSEIGMTGDLFNLYPAGTAPQEFAVWYYEGGGEALHQEMYDRKSLNVKADLGMFTSAELFGWFAKPVTSMNDFKGMKFRTAGIWGEMLNEAGAAVVTMPGGEIYESMQRGVIDAFEFSTPGVDWSAGFQELGAYVHGPGIHAPQSAFEFLVNKDQWNALPDDLKAIVDHACEATVIRSLAMVDYADMIGIQNLKDYGTEFVYLPEDVQKAIVVIANEKYNELEEEDEFFREVLESQREFVKSYREFKAFAQPDPNLMTYEG
jgi:TRAP-type mannitol/chloroaromatic compound transport system substrate-binding protein